MQILKDLCLTAIVIPLLIMITDCPICGDDRIRLCSCEHCGYHPLFNPKKRKKEPG